VLTFFHLVEVSCADSKYREVENLFQQTMQDYSIRRLRRTRSPTLWQHFQLFVSALLHTPGGSGAAQIMVGPPSRPPSVWVVPPRQKANRLPLHAAPYPSPRGAPAHSSGADSSDALIYSGKITESKNGRGEDKNVGALWN